MQWGPILSSDESCDVLGHRVDRTIVRLVAVAMSTQFERHAMITIAQIEANQVEGVRGQRTAMKEEGRRTPPRPIEIAKADA